MPLVRVQVRNEYGLGAPGLYREANPEDPKGVLEGVSVSGLVGILRQLGDLAEFSAEVFHDLQEQVIATAARSHRIIDRVKQIEAVLPPVEKAILAQKNHIHFAYSVGSDWHSNIQARHNHLIHTDLPQFILESYEECREPPRLHLLDKFDTAGPGACLKRYSDPSFFGGALPVSKPVTAEKVRRGKKAHKSKKKVSRQMNVGVSQAVLPSRETSRMQFASPSYRQNSTAETISSFGMRSKSDLADSSTSSDSICRSGYMDSVSDVNFSMRHEEQEDSEMLTSRLKMQHGDILGSIRPDEQNGVLDDDLPNHSLQEQSVPYSSSVTWDEKTEIVKPMSHQFDNNVEEQGEASDIRPASLDQSKSDSSSTSPITANRDGVSRENASEPFCDGNQFDEVGSDLDNYIDVLDNTISETETDPEHQTKQGVMLPSVNLPSIEIDCRTAITQEMSAQNLDSSDDDASRCSSNKQMSPSCSPSISSQDLVHAEPAQTISMCPNQDVSVDADLSGSTDVPDVSRVNDFGSAINDTSSSGCNIFSSEAPFDDKIVSSVSEARESPTAISGGSSTLFWTNGGLLGLEPSKPPECSVLNHVGEIPSTQGTKDDRSALTSYTVMPNSQIDGCMRKPEMLNTNPEPIKKNPSSTERRDRSADIVIPNDLSQDQLVRRTGNKVQTSGSSESSTLFQDKQDACVARGNSYELLSTALEAKTEKSKGPHLGNSFNNSNRHGLTEMGVMAHGAALPIVPDVKEASSDAHQENNEHSLTILGLSDRCPVNGFRRKVAHVDTSAPSSSLKSGLMKLQETHFNEQKKINRIVHRISPVPSPRRQFEHGSPASSLSSSPPLEHMTISFEPLNGFETSKMKLRFRDRHNFHDSISDVMFPSFQLIPETANSQHDLGCESDDDTFSRLSHYLSDEVMSQHSYSNSEQWESDEIPGSKGHEIYDALRRVSSEESISNLFQLGDSHFCYPDSAFGSRDTENGMKSSHASSLSNLPNFDSVNPITSQQEKNSDREDLGSVLQYSNEPSPPPPTPLLHRQEGIMKPPCAAVEEKQDAISKALYNLNDLQAPGSTTSQQSSPTSPKKVHNVEAVASQTRSKDQQKLNGHGDSKQTINGKDLDGGEDLLQQIRTKSFSLRHRVPAKSVMSSNPTTNAKVTAILQKANAIRQAFMGSDEGEDSESWSDQ